MKIPFLLTLSLLATSLCLAAPKTHSKTKLTKTLSPLSSAFRLSAGRAVEPGVVWNEVRLPGNDAGVTRLWIYRPAQAQSGDAKYPVVFVAPAGSALFYGMRQGSGDVPEQLPYARAGMIVVAYEIDGDLPKDARNEQTFEAARLFRRADGGISNAKRAIDWTLRHVARVDTKRLYVAGHSSAATLALQVAQNEPRIAACAAYAPVCDIENRVAAQTQQTLDAQYPGYINFMSRVSPINNAARLRCPTLLFHADDDSNVPTAEDYQFGQIVFKTNKKLVFSRVATGGHYNSMIQSGIPTAIRWFKSLPTK